MSNVIEFDSLIIVTKVIINFPHGGGMDYVFPMGKGWIMFNNYYSYALKTHNDGLDIYLQSRGHMPECRSYH